MNDQSGSIVVEASVVMTTFLMVVVSVLFLINVCRLQLRITSALNQTALHLSESSFLVSADLEGIFSEKLGRLEVRSERYNFNFSRSILYPMESNGDIILKVSYKVNIPFMPLLSFNLSQCASTGAWLGGDSYSGSFSDDSDSVESPRSIWSMNAFDRGVRFKEIMQEQYRELGWLTDHRGVIAYNSSTNTYYNCVSINTFSPGYNNDGFLPSKAAVHTLRKLEITKETVSVLHSSACIEYVVIVPEDASQDVVLKLKRYFNSVEKNIIFTLVQSGGNAGG